MTQSLNDSMIQLLDSSTDYADYTDEMRLASRSVPCLAAQSSLRFVELYCVPSCPRLQQFHSSSKTQLNRGGNYEKVCSTVFCNLSSNIFYKSSNPNTNTANYSDKSGTSY